MTSRRPSHPNALLRCLAFCLACWPGIVYPQLKFSAGLEAGVNTSGFSRKISTKDKDQRTVETIGALVRPVPGIWGKLHFGPKLFLSAGIQYLRVGSRTVFESVKAPAAGNLQSRTVETFQFDKVAYPLMIGCNFRVRREAYAFSLGVRPVRYLHGSYFWQAASSNGNVVTHASGMIDPFDAQTVANPVRRNQTQFLAGLAWTVCPGGQLGLQVATGDQCTFSLPVPAGRWCATGYVFSYSATDMQISFKYAVKESRGF